MSKLPKRKIGITGTIGSGKSTVTKIVSKNYPSISADSIVDDLYKSPKFIKKVNSLILNNNDQSLNKEKLAKVIFSDAKKREELENLIHPLVKDKIEDWLSKQEEMCFVEVPLLFEAKFEDLFDIIILVISDKDVIINRLKANRGYTKSAALSRIDQQLSVDQKIKKSDYLIYNNTTLKELEFNIDKLIDKIEKGE